MPSEPELTTSDAAAPASRRRKRDRAQTEADLMAAALRLLERNGVLAGLNLQEVAAEAGVNRVQIYQYFGTRESLLRAALNERFLADREARSTHRVMGFADRRKWMFRQALADPERTRLEALLAHDGDEDFTVFPELEQTLANLARDQQTGHLPPDADALVMHVMTAATYMGYCIFREVFARDTGIPVDELDVRAQQVYELMLEGLTGS
ncbi:hypothetical protein Rruber_05441 (plasmid) [Rhodococcus ruber]|uniref:TetR/AcrR family transcriptional regulator n=1 Tax=Rhodococcus ruber TaxID=1830 RepID=UPI00315D309B